MNTFDFCSFNSATKMSRVVFGERTGKSYAVTYFNSSGVPTHWHNHHGGPHVETPDNIQPGTSKSLSYSKKQPPAHYGNVIFTVEGVSNPKSDYGGHITVPMDKV